MLLRRTRLPLSVLLCRLIIVAGMADVWVELRAPRFVVHRHSATLRCEHNVAPEALYKVVFYKDGHRLSRFINGREPPFEIFNLTGAEINPMKLTTNSITVERMDFAAAGAYACEVMRETPLLYSKLSKIHEIAVIVRQKYRPKIKIRHKKLSPADYLEATCQSAPAYPAPHLTWFINNDKVDESLTIPHGNVNVHKHHHGMPLVMNNSSLQFPISKLQLNPNQTVEITCLSTIPSYASIGEGFADIQNHTISVNVVRNEPVPTQLPVKIVSSELNRSTQRELKSVIIILISFVIYVTMYL